MNDQEINITIAEACGWKDLENEDFSEYYCNDLNAMHEAERSLSEEQKEEYFYYLLCLSGNWPKAIQATARQRAEAFLRTIGKWKEAEK